jgi:uncharacterized protein YcfL
MRFITFASVILIATTLNGCSSKAGNEAAASNSTSVETRQTSMKAQTSKITTADIAQVDQAVAAKVDASGIDSNTKEKVSTKKTVVTLQKKVAAPKNDVDTLIEDALPGLEESEDKGEEIEGIASIKDLMKLAVSERLPSILKKINVHKLDDGFIDRVKILMGNVLLSDGVNKLNQGYIDNVVNRMVEKGLEFYQVIEEGEDRLRISDEKEKNHKHPLVMKPETKKKWQDKIENAKAQLEKVYEQAARTLIFRQIELDKGAEQIRRLQAAEGRLKIAGKALADMKKLEDQKKKNGLTEIQIAKIDERIEALKALIPSQKASDAIARDIREPKAQLAKLFAEKDLDLAMEQIKMTHTK